MRVTFSIASLNCGGAEKSLLTLCRYLSESRGIGCTIVTSYGEPYFSIPESINLIHGDFIDLQECEPWWQRYPRYITRGRALRRAIIESQPDIVVTFLDWFNTFTLISLIGSDIPVVVSERGLRSCHSTPFAWRVTSLLAYHLASGITFVTKDEEPEFRRYRTVPSLLVPGPIEPCSDVVRCRGASRFLAVGRLSPQKGFDRLIRAFSVVNRHKPDARLLIYGEGPTRDSLSKLIDELQLTSSVSLLGLHPAPFEETTENDCFVLTSRYEGFPRVLAEAMMRGLPVISFDCPGAPKEMIRNNQNGILVPDGDIEGFARAMIRMMEEPALAERLSQAAPSVAELCSPEVVGEKWVSFLRNILSHARSGRVARYQS
jgi:GalNAc-alpha-(1->4)-GalNAc-alpha-(1->3)-diNAcBac-PP-undecaprenol alpha-1,4-N-acetyl-D-galactosaminyltransferase